MACWYQHNRHLFHNERTALAESCPLMMLSVVGPEFRINSALVTKVECAIVHGTYILSAQDVQEEIEYGISLWLPGNYPNSPPIMFCNDPKLPLNTLGRHILKDGQACLEVWSEINRRWPPGSNLVDFLVNLVDPFLAWQVHYDAFGRAPEWGERAHGINGIMEYYSELIGGSVDDTIFGFMTLLARKNPPKGHEQCPCGTGKKLRHCHHKLIRDLRMKISWLDVGRDLAAIQSHDSKKKTWSKQ